MIKLAIIHTTPATIDPLKALAKDVLGDCDIINLVDDSILPQLARNGGNIHDVEDRLIQYACIANRLGVDVILEACSSVGEVVPKMAEKVTVPVVRIDDAMAEKAIETGTRIGVVATLSTTLNPTMRLLQSKADESGKSIELVTALADSAYQKLMSGDQEGHNRNLAETLLEVAQDVDVVVLAQASMARVLPTLPTNIQHKFLTSPQLGMKQVKQVLNQ